MLTPCNYKMSIFTHVCMFHWSFIHYGTQLLGSAFLCFLVLLSTFFVHLRMSLSYYLKQLFRKYINYSLRNVLPKLFLVVAAYLTLKYSSKYKIIENIFKHTI